MAAEAEDDDENDDPDDVESLMMVLKSIASMNYQSYLPEVYADSEGERRRYKPRHHHLRRICHPGTKNEHQLTIFGSMHTPTWCDAVSAPVRLMIEYEGRSSRGFEVYM